MSQTIAQALREGATRLAAAGIEDAQRDARRLMAHALSVGPERLMLLAPDPFPATATATWTAAVEARLRRQPVAQITGTRSFHGHEFRVTQDTLDPRPDTELLVDEAISHRFSRMLDLGTGTGCVLLSCLAAVDSATGVGTDISTAALTVARSNADVLALSARTEFSLSDWFAEVRDRFDLIVSNPPYISETEMADLSPEVRDWEPRIALTPGGDGLSAYREIASGAPERLLPGGRLIVEIGWRQGASVASIFAQAGFGQVDVLQDLNGHDRVVRAVRA